MPENNTIFVKPSQPGGVVRFPGDPKRTLAPEGEAVPRSAYWTRRLADQSVIDPKAEEEKAAAAKAAAAPAKPAVTTKEAK